MHNKSILLVDDEEIILNSISMDLRQENYDVTLATSAEEAISLLKDDKFDLVVTDLSMSGMDGIQVLKETKKINSLTGVIILTGYGDMISAIDALRLGADDYLLKPCESEELVIRLSRCLEKQAALQKVKFYENILPVCVYCKNIRDDTGTEPGKGKWLQMEEYIHTKSGTDISHGCCPECYEKHKYD
jgi:DNA-binding response OmpR family regulator